MKYKTPGLVVELSGVKHSEMRAIRKPELYVVGMEKRWDWPK